MGTGGWRGTEPPQHVRSPPGRQGGRGAALLLALPLLVPAHGSYFSRPNAAVSRAALPKAIR